MNELKEYKTKNVKAVKLKGFKSEGYDDILNYNLWFTLTKVTLTKEIKIKEELDIKRVYDINDLYNFVDKCKNQCLLFIDFDFDVDDDVLDRAVLEASKILTVQKTAEELNFEYEEYVKRINYKNLNIWEHHKKQKLKSNKDFIKYQLLKAKFGGL